MYARVVEKKIPVVSDCALAHAILGEDVELTRHANRFDGTHVPAVACRKAATAHLLKGSIVEQLALPRELSAPVLPVEKERVVELGEVTAQRIEIHRRDLVVVIVKPHRLGWLVEKKGRGDSRREDELLGERAAAAPLRVQQDELALTTDLSTRPVFRSMEAVADHRDELVPSRRREVLRRGLRSVFRCGGSMRIHRRRSEPGGRKSCEERKHGHAIGVDTGSDGHQCSDQE